MDSLIVLRKPLRKTQLEPKFIIPKKSKKAVPKVDPIPPNADLGEESIEHGISFVKLYKDLCVENSIGATGRAHVSSPTRVPMCLLARAHVSPPQSECPPGYLHVSPPQSKCPPGHLHVSPPQSKCPPGHLHVSPPQSECPPGYLQVSPPGHLHVNTPASRTDTSRSDTSVVTQYFGTEVECNRVFTDVPPPPSSARAELILELDYDTSFNDSGFC